jgi:acyl-CoA synthetase (AMP-forming)/AMP-acid ligase II
VVGLAPGDRYLVAMPFFHTFGYKAGWLACLMSGATVLPEPVFDPARLLARVSAERISVLPGPPALYQSILARPDLDRYDLSSLRLAVTGAAMIPVDLIERMRAELGFSTVITGYGLTETTGVATMCRHGDDARTIATTSGRALPGMEVRIVDGSGAELATGVAGEIMVRGYNVMLGYDGDPEGTAAAINGDGFLATGDIGVLDERGNLAITDRKKDMIIVGGFNVYPAEVEQLLCQFPGVAQVAVIGIPDDRLGEVAKAFVVAAPGAAIDPQAVLNWCIERIANFKVPRQLELIDELPRNASGKVQKFRLRPQGGSITNAAASP